jgi:hypothetical protein
VFVWAFAACGYLSHGYRTPKYSGEATSREKD